MKLKEVMKAYIYLIVTPEWQSELFIVYFILKRIKHFYC